MMKPHTLLLPAAVAGLLALGGCGKKNDDQPKAAAGGELLPRSVDDDMLPYDTVRSEASLSAPDAELRPSRLQDPAVAASLPPVEDTVVPEDTAPVIEPAPTATPSAQP